MSGVTTISSLEFWKLKTTRTAIVVIPFLVSLVCCRISVGGDINDITSRFQRLKGQYQSINTVHVKSQMFIKTYIGRVQSPPSDKVIIRQNRYEYWADKGGRYRVNSFFYDSNGNPEEAWDFAYDGDLFQLFERRSLVFSFGKKDPQQNPCAPENPLFAPLLFIGQDDDNCPACTLKLMDVMDVERWKNKTIGARVVKTSDQTPSQVVSEIPGGVTEGKGFAFRVYFGDANLPSKINRVDAKGNIITSIEIIAYKAITLNGKQVYWPKSVRLSSVDNHANTLAELNAEIEVCQINEDLPPDVFTIDFSSASAIWDDDAKIFVRQKGDVK